MAWRWTTHADADALVAACADDLQATTTAGIAAHGQAQFALAGGRTPFPIYRRWAGFGRTDARIAVTVTDERWLPANHPDNNLAKLQACFPGEHSPRWRPLVPESPGAEPDLATANANLALMAAPFDAVLLGMGEDGHFASLFPGDPGLAAALDPEALADAAVVRPDPLPPEAPYPRISLTLARLRRSRQVLLVVTGAAKRAVIEQAMERPDPARWPVSALLHAPGAPLAIHWSP